MLTIVAIAMVFSVSFMDYYDLNPSPAVVLLPIIVLTGLVDRVYAIADEKGLAVAIYRLVWTCLVAAICFMVFSVEVLRLTLVNYPELHFFTLSLILLCSAYKWKMLTETDIFKWIREPKPSQGKEVVSSDIEKNAQKVDGDK